MRMFGTGLYYLLGKQQRELSMRAALYKPLRFKENVKIEGESNWAQLEGMDFRDRFNIALLKRFQTTFFEEKNAQVI